MSVQFTEPVVKQTTVTVQNVMIGKRQLTQRVFKQILYEEVFDEEPNTLKGEVWGFVNYFWQDTVGYSSIRYSDVPVRHFLWVNKQGELRRFILFGFKEDNPNLTKHEKIIKHLYSLPQLFIAV